MVREPDWSRYADFLSSNRQFRAFFIPSFPGFFGKFWRKFFRINSMPVISFLYFHNYPGAFIKTCKFELLLLCQAVLWIRYYFFQFRIWIRIRICIRIPTIFSSFSNKFVGYNILRLNVRNVRCNVSMETFVILAKSSGSDLFRIWFWFHNYGAMVSFD